MKRKMDIALAALFLAFAAAPAAWADARDQLEAAAGISAGEAGQYSFAQLRYMVAVQSRGELNDAQKARKIERIKADRALGFDLPL